MDYVVPSDLVAASVEAGVKKSRASIKDLLIRGFYSGLALGVATTLAVTVAVQSGFVFLGALLFPWGFVSIVLLGMELVTGNFALMTSAMLAGRVRLGRAVNNWLWVYIGNFLGCLTVAILMGFSLTNGGTADPSPVGERIMAIALAKTVAVKEMGVNGFLLFIVRGIFCNFLVCLAVMMGFVSKSVPGKFIGCWFPIFAFVTLNLEHIVVNMFFITTGIVLGAPISGMDMVFWDFLPVTIGNIIGGGLFIGALLFSTHYVKPQSKIMLEAPLKEPVLR